MSLSVNQSLGSIHTIVEFEFDKGKHRNIFYQKFSFERPKRHTESSHNSQWNFVSQGAAHLQKKKKEIKIIAY